MKMKKMGFSKGIRGAVIAMLTAVLVLAVDGQVAAGEGDTRSIILQQYLESAAAAYHEAGFSKYFGDLALLWTETDQTRLALKPEFTMVREDKARELQRLLLKIFQLNPDQINALIWAGDYHYYLNQKQTALWYYERALAASPRYEPALLSLADYYLSEGQPEKAFQIVKDLSSPEAFLRKGIVNFKQGQYQLALGYLLQANLCSGELAIVRNKDLAKTLRALGGLSRAEILLNEKAPAGRIGQILYQDMKISISALEGNFLNTIELVDAGKKTFPGYNRWNVYLAWVKLQNQQAPVEIPQFEAEYRSAFSIIQAQIYWKQSLLEEAYRACSEALKADRRSLVGYLEAGNIQLKRKNYEAAVKLFTKGLEINPQFLPLLSKRAEAYEKLSCFAEAAGDRAAVRLADSSSNSSKLLVNISRSENGETYLNLQNFQDKLTGLWFSSNGTSWTYTPWGNIIVGKNIKEVWILPMGPGLSGEALRINLDKPNIKFDAPVITGETIEWRLPIKARLVVAGIIRGQVGPGFVTDGAADYHQIPLTPFGKGLQTFQVWYGLDTGYWIANQYGVNFGDRISLKKPGFILTTDQTVVNHRKVTLKILTTAGSLAGVKMAIGEAVDNSERIPFRQEYSYVLSPGDGPKIIWARFFDALGFFAETKLELKLDTTPPQLKNFTYRNPWANRYFVSWQCDEPVTAKVRIFSKDGHWSERIVMSSAGSFSTPIPVQSSLCQVLLTDGAGNTAIYTDQSFNRKLREEDEVRFVVNKGKPETNSRNISVATDVHNVSWSLSNDLQIWSNWNQGPDEVRWRIGSTPGEQIVYIRYRPVNDDHDDREMRYIAYPLYYEPLLSEILPK